MLKYGYATLVPVHGFTLNRLNYRAAAERLIPRAAAYSTGLINHFFRGRIDISLPKRGVFSVLDHGTTHAAGQGFRKVTVGLRNITPPGLTPAGNSVPQEMFSGNITLVAKYYLNDCYTPDLLGEYNGTSNYSGLITRSGCSLATYFGGVEKVSVSQPLIGQSITSSAPTEYAFDFTEQPIPVNAHDLTFQVLYEGVIGAEPDAIAVSATNASEPTWLSIINGSDYYAIDGAFYTPEEIRADPVLLQRVSGVNFDPEPLATAFSIGATRITDEGSLEAKSFHRLAVLADAEIRPPASAPPPLEVRTKLAFPSTNESEPAFLVSVIRNQLAREPYVLSRIGIVRGIPVWQFVYVYKATGARPTGTAAQKPGLVDPTCRLPDGQYVCAPMASPIPLAG